MFWALFVDSKSSLNLNLLALNVPFAKLLKPPKDPDAVCDKATCTWQLTSSAAGPSKLPSKAAYWSHKIPGGPGIKLSISLPITNPIERITLLRSRENTPPKSKISLKLYSPVAFVAGLVNCNALVELLNVVLVLVPWNGGVSKSSLSCNITWVSIRSGRSIMTLVSPTLKFPWSSWNLRIYSPSKLGTIASVVLPANAVTRSTEFWNVPLPSVRLLCLT